MNGLHRAALHALGAAVLFGASTPFAKQLIGTPPRTELGLALRLSLRELGQGGLLRNAELAPA